jgi:hypothetical protein
MCCVDASAATQPGREPSSTPKFSAVDSVGPLTLNQSFIEAAWRRFGVTLEPVPACDAESAGPNGGASAAAASPSRAESHAPSPSSADAVAETDGDAALDLSDPRAVFDHVFAQLPDVVVVYPTERYFYYAFDAGHRRISGNLRLTDVERGVVHIGYFDERDRAFGHAATFGAADGVAVDLLDAWCWRVRAGDADVRFRLCDPAAVAEPSAAASPYESVVSGILDESGLALTLVWDDASSTFFYVLKERGGVADRLVAVDAAPGHRLWIGQRTRFAFYDEPTPDGGSRKVLVGVDEREVFDNSYFDGPFDQVPPRLALRDKILRCWPALRGSAAIDEHGNYRDRPSHRVAISAYVSFATVDGLVRMVRDIAGAPGPPAAADDAGRRVRIALTGPAHRRGGDHQPPTLGEWLAGPVAPHHRFLSQGWPANHRRAASDAWPADHSATTSSAWPANHEGSTSDPR